VRNIFWVLKRAVYILRPIVLFQIRKSSQTYEGLYAIESFGHSTAEESKIRLENRMRRLIDLTFNDQCADSIIKCNLNPQATNVIYIYIYIYMEHLFLMFLDHTQVEIVIIIINIKDWTF
jgi:hypothetical protein